MMLRIIHGKLKPGTWDSYERAYKDVMARAGKIPGLRGRWLAHAVFGQGLGIHGLRAGGETNRIGIAAF